MLREFKEFAMRGNVVDIAVGVIIGAAFGAIVNSLVADMIMPPIGSILGSVDFSNLFLVLKQGQTPGPYFSLAEARTAWVVALSYGVFVNKGISFLIVAFVVFLLIKVINQLQREQAAPPSEPTSKDCPFCFSSIPIKAIRCPQCTSELLAAHPS